MGAETNTDPDPDPDPELDAGSRSVGADVTVSGTAPVQEIELFRGSERIDRASFDRGPDRVEVRWRGARGTGRDKVIDWSGGATLDRGEIEAATAVGVDRPTDGIVAREPAAVRWTATTTGNHQAIRRRCAVATPRRSATSRSTPT